MTLPKKRKNPWNKELKGATGWIDIPESLYHEDFSETETTYKSGRSGAYFNNPMTERRLVESGSEVLESTFSETGVLTSRRMTPEQKVLWRMIEHHMSGELSATQRGNLGRWMSHPAHIEVAVTLDQLRNTRPLSNSDTVKKFNYEVKVQELMTSLTRMLRYE
ncbi:hypothetical protein OAA10_00315 [bacterium]|nr:hypothetical protein [bacterium]